MSLKMVLDSVVEKRFNGNRLKPYFRKMPSNPFQSYKKDTMTGVFISLNFS